MMSRMSDVSWWVRLRRKLRNAPALYRALLHLRNALVHRWLSIFRVLIPARFELGPPKGPFSLFEQLRRGEVDGRIVLKTQPSPRTDSNSLRRITPLGQATQSVWPIFWTHTSDARLVGPTLLLQNGQRRIAVESAFGAGSLEDDAGYRQFRRPASVRLGGNWTSIVSRWASLGFFHWFMDALPRLALLPEFPTDTRIIVPSHLQHYHLDSLAWLGLTERIRPTAEQHLSIENFYFSSPTNMTGLFDPYAVEFLRGAFLARRDVLWNSPRRFFVHRASGGRGIVNETEVFDFFRARGWAIVEMEALPLAQQIQLFANAEQICALHGAALTNLLWCDRSCRVLELVSSTYMNGVYEGIAEAVGLSYDFLVCKGDADFKARVEIAALQKRLD